MRALNISLRKNIRYRGQLELLKDNDYEILYHTGKANIVVDTLSNMVNP